MIYFGGDSDNTEDIEIFSLEDGGCNLLAGNYLLK